MRKERDHSAGEWRTVTGLVLPEELKWPEGSSPAEIIDHLRRLLADDALPPEAARFVRWALGVSESNRPPNEL
jgi:hypothetical protein